MEEKEVEVIYEAPKSHMKKGAENTLVVIANIILVLGIIATIACALTIVFVETTEYRWDDYHWKTIPETRLAFQATGLVSTIVIFLSTLMTWASLKVYANISLTLKDINKKIK